MTRRSLLRSALIACAAAVVVGVAASGCGSSSRFFDDGGDEGLAANSPTIVGLAAGSMALQASLARVDAGNHAAVQPRPSVSASGDASAGTVELDFGSSSSTGNEIAEVDLREEVDAAYTRSGGGTGTSGTVNVTFPSLVARTDHLGSVDVVGSVVYTCSFSGATCSGTVTIDVTTVSGFDTSTVTGTLSYTITGGVIRYTGGSLSTDSTAHGEWTSSLGNLELDLRDPAFRFVDAGTVALTRTSGSALGVSLLFTSPDRGTLTITPGATTRSFEL